MDEFIEKIREKTDKKICALHKERADVRFSKLKVAFIVTACCEPFKRKILKTCEAMKLEYLKNEYKKRPLNKG